MAPSHMLITFLHYTSPVLGVTNYAPDVNEKVHITRILRVAFDIALIA